MIRRDLLTFMSPPIGERERERAVHDELHVLNQYKLSDIDTCSDKTVSCHLFTVVYVRLIYLFFI